MAKKSKIKDIASLMLSNWKTLLLIITFDILFMLSLSSLRFIQLKIDDTLFTLFTNGKLGLAYSIFYIIFEFSLLILLYSFFKYLVIELIDANLHKSELKLKGFFSFFKLNLIIFIPLIILFVTILNLVVGYLGNLFNQGGIDPFIFAFIIIFMGILFILLFIYIYNLINTLHFAFLKQQNLKKLIKKGIINSFKINNYKIYWTNFKIILIFAIFLLIIHFFVKSFILDDFSSYIRNMGNYKLFIYWAIALIIYSLVLFNRFSFHMEISNVYKEKKS